MNLLALTIFGSGSLSLPLAEFGLNNISPYLIPLAGIGLALGVLVLGTIDKMQKRRLRHELLRVALEKGQPLPPELLEDDRIDREHAAQTVTALLGRHPSRRRGDRVAGFINLAIGAALMIALYALPNHAYGCYWFGLVPGFIGLALLLNWALERREDDKR